jgi:hypothetical protein
MRKASVHVIKDAFDALYMLWKGKPMRPPMDPILMIRQTVADEPCASRLARITLVASRVTRTAPKKLVPN